MKPYFVRELRNKLFLCSGDISLHEECWLKNEKVIPNQIHAELRSKCYKIIGEISPNSIVKEGDQFDEDDFYIKDECPHYNGKHMWKDCSCKIGFVNGIYIK
jgi:hypothetical protein